MSELNIATKQLNNSIVVVVCGILNVNRIPDDATPIVSLHKSMEKCEVPLKIQ